ncbi:hypothetical protein Glove_7g45 [Diversispora epigaea]|uniref:Uncharacterized protein n=1 Tax=Diversispora epigaea TaxID=1348612 RepID=A0A397JP60_9GLOM|nr:hypothetical protein Glove_7g45 [Diversispora epigaea]
MAWPGWFGKFHETDEDLVFISQRVNTKSFEEIQNGRKSKSFVAVVGQTMAWPGWFGKFHETDEDLVFISQRVNTKSFEEIQNGRKSKSFVAVVGIGERILKGTQLPIAALDARGAHGRNRWE